MMSYLPFSAVDIAEINTFFSSTKGKDIETEFRIGSFIPVPGKSDRFQSGVSKEYFELFKKYASDISTSKKEVSTAEIYDSKEKMSSYRKITTNSNGGSTANIEFQKKTRIGVKDYNFFFFGVRIAKSQEIVIDEKEFKIKTEGATVTKRNRERIIFMLNEPYKGNEIHLTTIEDPNSISREIEIEVLNRDNGGDAINLLNHLIKNTFGQRGNIFLKNEEMIRRGGLIDNFERYKARIQPSTLRDIDPDDFQRTILDMENYSTSNKLDGVRYYLFYSPKYTILNIPYKSTTEQIRERVNNLLIYPSSAVTSGGTSIDESIEFTSQHDGEFFQDSWYHFDTIKIGKDDLSSNPFSRRYIRGKEEVKKMKTTLSIKEKEFQLVDSKPLFSRIAITIQKMFKEYKGDKLFTAKNNFPIFRKLVEENDGIVFISEDPSKYSFKYKFIWRTTIDFRIWNTLLLGDKGKKYTLSFGKDSEFPDQLQNTSYKNKIRKVLEISSENKMYDEIKDGSIVEFKFREDEKGVKIPTPLIPRPDKEYPNSFPVVNSVIKNIMNPILFRILIERIYMNPSVGNYKEKYPSDSKVGIVFRQLESITNSIALGLDYYYEYTLGLSPGKLIDSIKSEQPSLPPPLSAKLTSPLVIPITKPPPPPSQPLSLIPPIPSILPPPIPIAKLSQTAPPFRPYKQGTECGEVKGNILTATNGVKFDLATCKLVSSSTNLKSDRFHNNIKEMVIRKVFYIDKQSRGTNTNEPLYNILDVGAGNGGDWPKVLCEMDNFDKYYMIEPKEKHIKEMKRRLETKIGELKYSRDRSSLQTSQLNKIEDFRKNIIFAKVQDVDQILTRTENVRFVFSFFSLTFMVGEERSFSSLIKLLDEGVMVGGYFAGTTMDRDVTRKLLLDLDNQDDLEKTKPTSLTVGESEITKIYNDQYERMDDIYNDDGKKIKPIKRLIKLGDKIRIKYNRRSIGEQEEFLVDYPGLSAELRRIGFAPYDCSGLGVFKPPENMEEQYRQFSSLNRSFIFIRKNRGEKDGSLQTLAPKTYKRFINYIDKSIPLVRIGARSDGNCAFHAILQAFHDEYNQSDRERKSEIALEFRENMSKKIKMVDFFKSASGSLKYINMLERETYSKIEDLKVRSEDEKNKIISSFKSKLLLVKDLLDDEKTFKGLKEKTIQIISGIDTHITPDFFDNYEKAFKYLKTQIGKDGEWMGFDENTNINHFEFIIPQLSSDYGINLLMMVDATRMPRSVVRNDQYNPQNQWIIIMIISERHYETVGELFLNTYMGSEKIEESYITKFPTKNVLIGKMLKTIE